MSEQYIHIVFDPSHSQDIVNYYYNYYIHNCPTSESFWATSSALTIILRLYSFLFPFHIFVGYCILYKTPKPMKFIRTSLFNAHFWASICDFLLCVLFKPYAFIPMLAGFPMGLMQTIGIPTVYQFYLVTVALLYMSISFCALSENRFSSISINTFRIVRKRTRLQFFGSFVFICSIYQIPMIFNLPEQNSSKLEALKKFPCPTQEFFTKPVLFYLIPGVRKNYFVFSNIVICSLLFIQFTFFFTVSAYYLYFVPYHSMSIRTQRLQKSFFIKSVFQITIPFVFIIIPFCILFICIIIEHSSPIINNFSIIIISSHGIVSTFLILFIYNPYRKYFLHSVGQMDENLKAVTEQLRIEAAMDRTKVSVVVKDLIDFCENNKTADGLVSPSNDDQNPFQKKKSCALL